MKKFINEHKEPAKKNRLSKHNKKPVSIKIIGPKFDIIQLRSGLRKSEVGKTLYQKKAPKRKKELQSGNRDELEPPNCKTNILISFLL